MSGDTLVVGAPLNNNRGAAYVFTKSGDTWIQQAKITANDSAIGDDFGSSVAISGDTIAIGARAKNSYQGAAYIFTRSGGNWNQQTKLSISGVTAGEAIGTSVALNDNTVFVGAPYKDQYKGVVYVFNKSGNNWTQQAKLASSDGSEGDGLGMSIATSGDTVAACASRDESERTGSAYIFTRSGSNWSQQANLLLSDAGDEHSFYDTCSSVDLSANIAVVGNDINGVVYVFYKTGGTWTNHKKLTADQPYSSFGRSVVIDNNTALVGSLGGSGSIYVFVP